LGSVENVGLFQYNKKENKFVPAFRSKINWGIGSIFLDSNDNLWLGSNTCLTFINPKDSTIINYTKTDGLPTNLIVGILEDDHKNLWISTSAGLIKCKNIVNHPDLLDLRVYSEKDGLLNKHFFIYSFYKNRSGELFFGGIKGLSMFHPDSVKDNPYPTQIAMTDLKIFNKSVGIGQKIQGKLFWRNLWTFVKKLSFPINTGYLQLNLQLYIMLIANLSDINI